MFPARIAAVYDDVAVNGKSRRKPADPVRAESRVMLSRVTRLVEGHEHVFAGPWAGEIGYELLYWIPFLRWLVRSIPGLGERLTVCSRGGVESWYADLTPRYVELFDLVSAYEDRIAGRIGIRNPVDEIYGTLQMDESVDEFIEQIRGR